MGLAMLVNRAFYPGLGHAGGMGFCRLRKSGNGLGGTETYEDRCYMGYGGFEEGTAVL